MSSTAGSRKGAVSSPVFQSRSVPVRLDFSVFFLDGQKVFSAWVENGKVHGKGTGDLNKRKKRVEDGLEKEVRLFLLPLFFCIPRVLSG